MGNNSNLALIRQVFSLDLRSIALFRIALALLILSDLLLRSTQMEVFYTDKGVLPRTAHLQLTHQWHWSLHTASGELWWQIALFTIAGLAAFALLLGYRSKLCSAISFVLLASLLNRNGLVLQGGDQLLASMSFWALFLPLGARYSIDSALQPEMARNPNAPSAFSQALQPYFSVATIAIVLQILYLYIFTAMMKTGDAWLLRFDAAYYALSLQHFATPLGQWLLQFPGFLKLATVYVLFVEFIAPLLVLCPFLWPRLRMLGLLLLASLHVAFLAMLHIGLFPFIDFMALSLLIPGAFWLSVSKLKFVNRRRKHLAGIRIYYDEDCGFCLKMCLILRAILLPEEVQILPAQNYPDIYPIMERENSWVVANPAGRTFTHWHAMAYLFSQPWPFRPLGWLMNCIPFSSMGNIIYRWVASNRGLMSLWSSQWLPYRQLRTRATVTGSIIALVFFYIVTAFNIFELPRFRGQMPEHINHLARIARVDQRWDMFAPFPLTLSSYVLIPGKLRSGEQIDLYELTSSDPQWQAPARFYPLFENYRWRKYLGRVDGHSNNVIRQSLGHYLCRSWNSQPRDRETELATLEIHFVKLQTNTSNTEKKETRRMVWRHWCFEEFADP